jgi:trehalose 6-phosphate phosphatase
MSKQPKQTKAARLGAFLRAVAAAQHSVLMLDYDGTLAGFRVDRFQARPWAGVREFLTLIQNQGKTRLAIITGRPPEEIQPMLQLDPPVEVWGLHGAKRLYPDGRSELESAPQTTRKALDAMRAQLSEGALGGLYEDKPNAAVMHWRGLSPRQAKAVEARTRALFQPLAKLEGLTVLEFEAGLELRVGRDKGGAVRAILRECPKNAPAAYLGDDWTDEAAFEAVNVWRGPHFTALVKHARRKTAADAWLKPPAELRGFLKAWAEEH